MNSFDKSESKIKGIILLSAIISCFFAFVNKYPIIYPDVGTYIYSGFSNKLFDDRPMFYGFFLRHVSMAASLWFVVFTQSLFVCYLIFITIKMFIVNSKRNYVFIFIILFLTLFTGFSCTVSILIPDIFSAISILCLINLLLNHDLKRIQIFGISVLFVFSVCTQFSNLAVTLLLLIIMLVYLSLKRLKKQKIFVRFKRILLCILLFFSCFLLIPSVNYGLSKQFRVSGISHIFIMNHLIETGVLQEYLEDNCASNNFAICNFKDGLGWDFIWSETSPLQKTGGWKANENEYTLIIKDVFSTPKYLVILSQKSIEYFFKQFFAFNIVIAPPQLEHSAPFGQISWHFKNTLFEYRSSLQNSSHLNVTFLNTIQPLIVLSSFVFLITILLDRSLSSKLNKRLKWAVIFVMLFDLLSCFVCSNLSTVDSRFQNRIAWLFPLFSLIIIIKFTLDKASLSDTEIESKQN